VESRGPQHFIGCLFTSQKYGKGKDSPAQILASTGPAVEDLYKAFNKYNHTEENKDKITEIRMCQINSGLFGVPWENTKAVIEGLEIDGGIENNSIQTEIVVYSMPLTT